MGTTLIKSRLTHYLNKVLQKLFKHVNTIIIDNITKKGVDEWMASYVTFELPDDMQQKILELFDIARNTGKIKKGANEVTKAIERGTAKIVIIAGDVEPPEIVMHLGPLCEEKGITYAFIKSKKQVGSVIGVGVSCSSAAVLEAGEGTNVLKDLKEKIKKHKK